MKNLRSNIILFFKITVFSWLLINIKNILIVQIKIKQMNNKLRICICTLGKNENKYIREFVYHYKKYGVDKIFLYDNNNIDGERFDDVISDFKRKKFVEIVNFRGAKKSQFQIDTDCYQKNNKSYDWLIFYDLDEYIYLKNYTNIKPFLSEAKFNECKIIYLNSIRHTDNDLLQYDNRPLAERFPIINWDNKLFTVKSIIRGNISKIQFSSSHWLDKSIKGCNSLGKRIKPNLDKRMYNDIKMFKDCYIDHYCFKSTEEFINKIKKGDAIHGKTICNILHKISLYFGYNNITYEKIKYIEKETGLSLNEYKSKIKKTKRKFKKKKIKLKNKKKSKYVLIVKIKNLTTLKQLLKK